MQHKKNFMHNLCNYLTISALASGAMSAVCCKHHVLIAFELSRLFFEFFELLPNNCFWCVYIVSVCLLSITYATDEDSCIAVETFG